MDHTTRRGRNKVYIVDASVNQEMKATKPLVQRFNQTDWTDAPKLKELAYQILGSAGENLSINPPFYCDYGTRITVGDNFFANYNCTILDVGKVTIGNHVFFAPNVSIYAEGHPVHPITRNSMYEHGFPVTIGNNVWVGGNTVINSDVTIGDNVVIGSGSVVTRDIPASVIAAGNPCRVIRQITDEDKKYYFKKLEFDDEAMADIYK